MAGRGCGVSLRTMKTILIFLFCCLLSTEANTIKRFPLLMPNVVPKQDDSYFCTPIKIDPDTDYYITGFQPNSTEQRAHHMLLYGCATPGSNEEVWNCGSMALSQPGYKTASTCGDGSQVVYAWALDAPSLVLPKGVAFKVGKSSPIKYLVLQVHYASAQPFKDGATDDSGVFVYYKEEPEPYSAGVLLLGTGGRILANSVEYMETDCIIGEHKELHPFAFRTHTHGLGKVVSGYKVVRKEGEDEWTLLGKKDPQLPQMFYPIQTNTTLKYGDRVAARCTMVSNRDTVTRIGDVGTDEMCNFYLMYYVKGTDPMTESTCFSPGPPVYRWEYHFNTIPRYASYILPEDRAPPGQHTMHHG